MDKEGLKTLLQRLPNYPNIMGKEKFFNAAVLIPVFFSNGEYHLVFEKRAAEIRQGGEVCFPGGEFEVDTDVTCKEAAIRETTEELGISRDKISILGRMDTCISPRGITVDSFVGELYIESLTDLLPDHTEVQDIFSLPVAWFEVNPPEEYRLPWEVKSSYLDSRGRTVDLLPIEDLGLSQGYRERWSGVVHSVFVYRTPQTIVWGITAELVRELIDKLGIPNSD